MNSVLIKSYNEPKFNMKEILRYISGDESLIPMVEECLEECQNELIYKVCYLYVPIKAGEGFVEFPFGNAKSCALAKNLSNCREAVIFGATVGIGLDRLIAKYGRISPAKGVIFQGIGAERIEALCDEFINDLEKEGLMFKPRFSPGYGDLPLEFQKDLFRVLDCPRKIGLSLTESLLMSPSKSVTAIAGIIENQGEILELKI